jgi:hypothetical protein
MSLDLLDTPKPAPPAPPAAVDADLLFIERSAEKPYTWGSTPPEGAPFTSGIFTPRPVRLENARPIAEQLSLDVEGIAIVRHTSAVGDFWDEAQTLALGHPETAELVKQVTGASRVVVFDHTRRRSPGETPDAGPSNASPPASRIHVDQTIWSGPNRVRQVMAAQAEALLTRRAAIINVWRPIGHIARRWPLALGDASSIDPNDLIGTDLLFEHRKGEIYNLAFNPAQRWLFVPDLEPDEAILIKCWDSDASVARFVPHAGFDDPSTPPGTPARQSIELRTIAFFD